MSSNNNLALVSPKPRPERKLDDVVLVFPGNTTPHQSTFQKLAEWLHAHGELFMRECSCGTTFVSVYEIGVDEAQAIHNKALCPLQRKQPKKA